MVRELTEELEELQEDQEIVLNMAVRVEVGNQIQLPMLPREERLEGLRYSVVLAAEAVAVVIVRTR